MMDAGSRGGEYRIDCLAVFPWRTKIFIRHPRTLFATEDAFQVCKHKLGEMLFCKPICNAEDSTRNLFRVKLLTVTVAATRIQAKYKGYRVKGDYLKQKEAGKWQLVIMKPQNKNIFLDLLFHKACLV